MKRIVMLLTLAGLVSGAQLLVGLSKSSEHRETITQRLYAVSSPESADYGNHLSLEELAELTAADELSTEVCSAWLERIGATEIRRMETGDTLFAEWNAHNDSVPSIPVQLADVVDFVIRLDPKLYPKQQSSPKRKYYKRNGGMDLASQKAAYGVPAGLQASHPKNRQMVWGTGSFGFGKEDLEMFYSTYAHGANIEKVVNDGANKWDGHDGKNYVEGMLDTSYISGMTGNITTLVSNSNVSAKTESGEAFGAALLAFLVQLNARQTEHMPLVLSMSLGSLSFHSCDTICTDLSKAKVHTYDQCWSFMQKQFQVCMFESAAQQESIDLELMKLGLRGVTVLAASGDGGSHFSFGPFSTGGIGDAINAVACRRGGLPVYPAASEYVLSVGGTQWQGDSYGPTCTPSKPCGWDSSGGGFSLTPQHNTTASFQKSFVNAYLKKAATVAPSIKPPSPTPAANLGRGYPDLAALAAFGIPVCDYGGCSGSGGTSASAPTVAGMLSLINDARLAKNLPPLGFVLPSLYALATDDATYAECFEDVSYETAAGGTYSKNWDCESYSTCTGCKNGYPAVKSWDPQTGLGQPKFPGLLKHLGSGKAVPTPPPSPSPPSPSPPKPSPSPPTPKAPTPHPSSPTPPPAPPSKTYTVERFEADPAWEFVVKDDVSAALGGGGVEVCFQRIKRTFTYVALSFVYVHLNWLTLFPLSCRIADAIYSFGTTHCDLAEHISIKSVAKVGDVFFVGKCP
jgi:hypothetical protein